MIHNLLLASAFAASLLCACARQAPPPSSAPDAKPSGDESQRQSQRADDQKAVDAAANKH